MPQLSFLPQNRCPIWFSICRGVVNPLFESTFLIGHCLNVLNPAPGILSFSAPWRTVTMLLQRANLPRIEFTRQKRSFRGTKIRSASGQNRPLSFEPRDRWQV
jgi:hypothetical protein